MDELVKKQLESNKVVNEENLKLITNKNFSSGRKIKVGDVILYGLAENDDKNLTLTSFHKDEIDVLYSVESPRTGELPILKNK